MFVFFAVAILNIICGIKKTKVNILIWITWLLLFVFMVFNCGGYDINNYILYYNNVVNNYNIVREVIGEGGYIQLMFFCNKIGLGFYAFRTVITIPCFILLNSVMRRFKVNKNMILGLYMLYSYFLDIIQLRNFVVEIIVLFAIAYLIKNSIGSTIKYLICIFVAAQFHRIAYVYLLLIFYRFIMRNKLSIYLVLFSILLYWYFFFFRSSLSILMSAAFDLLGIQKSYGYTISHYGSLPCFIIYITTLFSIFYFRYLINGKLNNSVIKYKIDSLIAIMSSLAVLLPVLLINVTFYRIFRNIIILSQIALFLIYHNFLDKKNHKKNCMVLLIGLTLCWGLYDIVLHYGVENIINTTFEENIIFSFSQMSIILECVGISLIILLGFFLFCKLFYNKSLQIKKIRIQKWRLI